MRGNWRRSQSVSKRRAGLVSIRASKSRRFEAAIGSTYTFDTISYLKRRCPGVHFVWLMGADNFRSLRSLATLARHRKACSNCDYRSPRLDADGAAWARGGNVGALSPATKRTVRVLPWPRRRRSCFCMGRARPCPRRRCARNRVPWGAKAGSRQVENAAQWLQFRPIKPWPSPWPCQAALSTRVYAAMRPVALDRRLWF